MKKKEEETKKQAVPVMKQLARLMSKEELATVNGAHSMGTNFWDGGGDPSDLDNQN